MYMFICICIYTGLLDAKSLSSSVIKSLETGVDIGDTQSTLRQYENDRYIKNLGKFFENKIMCLASSSLNFMIPVNILSMKSSSLLSFVVLIVIIILHNLHLPYINLS